ncbi:MAG: hypothetical protein ACSLE9_07880 [Burkholderiaceae bacterium]
MTQTRYEIALIAPDGNRYRLPLWTRDKGNAACARAFFSARLAIGALTGYADFEWNAKAKAFETNNGWAIRATGRTQRGDGTAPLPVLAHDDTQAPQPVKV